MTTRRWLGLAALAALVLLGGRLIAGLYVDYRWYASLGGGALSVWRARMTDLAALRLVLTLLGAGFVFTNLFGVSSSVESFVLPRRLGDLEIGEKVPGRQLLWAAGALAIALGVTLSLVVDDWMSFDLVEFARPFGVPEPYTGADLSFFLYWLPLENALYLWGIGVLLATSALVVLLYALTTGLRWEQGRLRMSHHVRRHVTALAAGLLLVLAWGHRLDAYSLLSGGSGPDGAFVFVDHAVALRARFALATLTAIGALLVLNAGWQGQGRLTFWVVTGVLVATLLLRGLVPAIGARVMSPDEMAQRNVPYLRNRAAVTQNAYGVNEIQRVPNYGYATADSTAGRVPLWDPAVLARAVERERRGEIIADDIGWQAARGTLAAVTVTRPVPPSDGDPVSWSALLVAGAEADASGEPVLLDTAGVSTTGITSPEAAGRDRRLVSFPQASGPAIVSDSGHRLVADPIRSFWPRLAHAWDERDFRLLFSEQLDRIENPAIVLRRGVRERLAAVAPFFVQGHAITPLLMRDTLYWVCHLYAASESFPLSQRYAVVGETWGYFQHAGIGIVNAESGAVSLLTVSSPDRLTEAWTRRFPALFGDAAKLSPALLASLPPPTDGVLVQAWALSQYGSRNDLTTGPVHLAGGEGSDSTIGVAARALALLPGPALGQPVPGWTLPLLDSADRVAGVLVALGGPSPVTLWVANRTAGARWGEIIERLRSRGPVSPEPAETRELTRGRIRVLPFAGGLAYGQPIYALRGAGQAASAGVAAYIGDTVRVASTVAEALGGRTPRAAAHAAAAVRPAPASDESRIRALYDAMRAAMRRGDFAAFGAAFDSLGALLGRPLR